MARRLRILDVTAVDDAPHGIHDAFRAFEEAFTDRVEPPGAIA